MTNRENFEIILVNQEDKGLKSMKKITMTVEEVAEFLGVSITTIYSMVRNSEIPHFKVRSRILFNRDVIEEWTKGNYQKEQKVIHG